ncbi:MAG: tetratricopeptide repeat protein [Bacteroidetes bacterium]|nr:tetratricopeptide repeat protein [Bacteroidota bacterium]
MTLATIFSILLASIQVIPMGNAKKHGRNGNDSLKQGQYEGAAYAYQEGLSSYESTQEVNETYYGLQNNLGIALHQKGDFEGARNAFGEALAHAPHDRAKSTPAYNAGNNAFKNQQLEEALAHYREALLADPDNEDAKYNFEFVSRQLQEQQQQSENNDQEQEEEQDQQQDQNDQPSESDQEQDENQEENPQEQEEQSQQEQQEEQQEQEPQQEQQREAPLTREQAERILEALENEEEELLREMQKMEGRPRRVAKDW